MNEIQLKNREEKNFQEDYRATRELLMLSGQLVGMNSRGLRGAQWSNQRIILSRRPFAASDKKIKIQAKGIDERMSINQRRCDDESIGPFLSTQSIDVAEKCSKV